MANGDKDGKNNNGHFKSVYLALYFIGAVVSGAGGNYIWMRQVAPDVIAPDRFTGTQASILSSRVDALEYHVRNHPDQTNQFDRRITVVETNQRIIIANQERILGKLDRK